MGIGRPQVGQVRHHGDVVTMPLERSEPLGHPDVGEPPSSVRIKGVFGEPEPATEKDDAFRWCCGGILRCREGFEKWDRDERAARVEERTAGSGMVEKLGHGRMIESKDSARKRVCFPRCYAATTLIFPFWSAVVHHRFGFLGLWIEGSAVSKVAAAHNRPARRSTLEGYSIRARVGRRPSVPLPRAR